MWKTTILTSPSDNWGASATSFSLFALDFNLSSCNWWKLYISVFYENDNNEKEKTLDLKCSTL